MCCERPSCVPVNSSAHHWFPLAFWLASMRWHLSLIGCSIYMSSPSPSSGTRFIIISCIILLVGFCFGSEFDKKYFQRQIIQWKPVEARRFGLIWISKNLNTYLFFMRFVQLLFVDKLIRISFVSSFVGPISFGCRELAEEPLAVSKNLLILITNIFVVFRLCECVLLASRARPAIGCVRYCICKTAAPCHAGEREREMEEATKIDKPRLPYQINPLACKETARQISKWK